MRSRFSRDNIPGHSGGHWVLRVFLFPGTVIQWVLYMTPTGNYARVRGQTRHARSPLMTIVFSSGFWFCVMALILSSIFIVWHSWTE
jgi:hypothetical protein